MRRKNLLRNLSLSLISSIIITSCWWNTKETVIEDVVCLDTDIAIPARPKKLTYLPMRVDAVSYKNLEEFLAENEKRNGAVVFIAIDVKEWEKEAFNTAEFMRYIRQQGDNLDYWESKAKGVTNEPSETAQDPKN